MIRARTLLIAVIPLLLVAAIVPALQYRQYLHAVAWHLRHGNHATLAGHHIRLPLFWWQEADPARPQSYDLRHACSGMVCIDSEIALTRMPPSQESALPASDQDALDQLQRKIALWQARAAHSSTVAIAISALTLRTPSHTLVCEKIEWKIKGPEPRLDCTAAHFPWSVSTNSFHPGDERASESILSTLE